MIHLLDLQINMACPVHELRSSFSKFVPLIARQLEPLIHWPSPESTRRCLPVPFRARYSAVVSIIDAFEIEIEKPSDSITQSMTWSSYKSANTIKYLVSITPDGLINFVSIGYGGRISDLLLTTESGFLEKLPPNKFVMTDRGFKHLDKVFAEVNCKLLRPPSVSEGQIISKQQVRLAKRIASLRIHVERSIRRLREFLFLAPHACTDNKLVNLLDDCVIIACALVNLQPPLIR